MTGMTRSESGITFLLGPAGSGKTYRCLEAIRCELKNHPEGPPLLLITPRQATFQMETDLLSDPCLQGFTRLQILSFPRLAEFILGTLAPTYEGCISEEGRIMVLRSILNRCASQLVLFKQGSRHTGLATEMSHTIRECQHHGVTPARLLELSQKPHLHPSMACKLKDIALIFGQYEAWLDQQRLHDPDHMLDLATQALTQERRKPTKDRRFLLKALWLDGFASLTPQERSMLKALCDLCQFSTLAFCADSFPPTEKQLFSIWLPVHQTVRACMNDLAAVHELPPTCELLERSSTLGRFTDAPMLRWLEASWTRPSPCPIPEAQPQSGNNTSQLELGLPQTHQEPIQPSIEMMSCSTPAEEVAWAARIIMRETRERGARYKDIAVLVRSLEDYHDLIRHQFQRLEIPCFMDQRESIVHHPLVALTRSALRLLAHGWMHDDWFTYLKSGLISLPMDQLDALENTAIERGWRGDRWWLPLSDSSGQPHAFEPVRLRLLQPFESMLRQPMQAKKGLPKKQTWTGNSMSEAIRRLWTSLGVTRSLEDWDAHPLKEGLPHQDFHLRVLETMESLLDNLEMAFREMPLPIHEWLPIMESGMSHLSVGVVPPALDQVMVGAVDRSRQSSLKTVILLGLNESVFPARPSSQGLWDETEREALEQEGILLETDPRIQLALERFLGYIACTRPRKQLCLSHARASLSGQALHPSVLIDHLRRLFPWLEVSTFDSRILADQAFHERELMVTRDFWKWRKDHPNVMPSHADSRLGESHKWLAGLTRSSESFSEKIHPDLAAMLFGDSVSHPQIQTSVSRMESFAECPFRFFLHAGLRLKERQTFELDARRMGIFQHHLLESFHLTLQEEGKQWHDLTTGQGAELLSHLAEQMIHVFDDGLLEDKATNQLMAKAMTQGLRIFIEVLMGWMKHYPYEPRAVELSFGQKDSLLPPWRLPIRQDAAFVFQGVIDRLDFLEREDGPTLAVIIDYKSSLKKLDPTLSWNGLQLQLPVYLNVLRQPEVASKLDQTSIRPTGAFFVPLKSAQENCDTRDEALDAHRVDQSHQSAYQHHGCFDMEALQTLDTRPGSLKGTQIDYHLKKDGTPRKSSWQAKTREDFEAFMNRSVELLKRFGDRLLQGDIPVEPYRHGQMTPCQYCDYSSVCRIDTRTHSWRTLQPPQTPSEKEASSSDQA